MLLFYYCAFQNCLVSYKYISEGWVNRLPGQTVEVILQSIKSCIKGSAHLDLEFLVYEVRQLWTPARQTLDFSQPENAVEFEGSQKRQLAKLITDEYLKECTEHGPSTPLKEVENRGCITVLISH